MEKLNWDEEIKNIPAGSVVFVWGESLLSRIIRRYQKWDTTVKDTPTHAMVYLGSGCHQCVSAEFLSVKKISLDKFKKNRIEIYSYRNMTVDQLQRLKSYLYGSVGRLYDVAGLVSFLGNLIKRKLPQWKFANFCSENVAEAFEHIGIRIMKNKKPSEQHPAGQWLAIVEIPKEWKLKYPTTYYAN